MIAAVIYEDQWGETKDAFAPHQLVLQCVADRAAGETLWSLREQLIAIPKNGDTKVLRAIRQDAARIAPQGQPIFALLDRDKIHRPLNLPGSAKPEAILKAIAPPENVEILLLMRNMEDVVRAVAACHGDLDPALLAQAAEHKALNARDSVLNAATYGTRTIRDCVLDRIEALKVLVEKLTSLLPSASPPT